MTGINIAQALNNAQNLGLDRLDAQLLLLHALGRLDTERAWLIAHDLDPLPQDIADAFQASSLRRAAGEPLAYIVGYKEFFGLRFMVNPSVLIPRPDTETLVQWALDVLKSTDQPELLDLGTGSGAVAISVASSLKRTQMCKVMATDFSDRALKVASHNAKKLGVQVVLVQSDWLKKVSGHFQLIVSNPPYIAIADPHLANLTHEPVSALAAGSDGLDDIRKIVEDAPTHLHPDGWLLLEHGYDQASAVRELLGLRGFKQIQSRMDLAGIERCTGGQWQNDAITQ